MKTFQNCNCNLTGVKAGVLHAPSVFIIQVNYQEFHASCQLSVEADNCSASVLLAQLTCSISRISTQQCMHPKKQRAADRSTLINLLWIVVIGFNLTQTRQDSCLASPKALTAYQLTACLTLGHLVSRHTIRKEVLIVSGVFKKQSEETYNFTATDTGAKEAGTFNQLYLVQNRELRNRASTPNLDTVSYCKQINQVVSGKALHCLDSPSTVVGSSGRFIRYAYIYTAVKNRQSLTGLSNRIRGKSLTRSNRIRGKSLTRLLCATIRTSKAELGLDRQFIVRGSFSSSCRVVRALVSTERR